MSASPTIDFYNNKADDFFAQTVGIDMAPLYERFLELLPAGGSVLDAGCGSGRDSKAFLERGFRVTAFDASEALATKASVFLEQDVRCCRFDEITEVNVYDGVWACASLLHVAEADLKGTVELLVASLRPGGVLFASFKEGNGSRMDTLGRHFTDMTLDSIEELLDQVVNLEMLEAWQTSDRRSDRTDQQWWNFIGRKRS
jgi:2-polyprenyl-3-methyl-5-hydroxy-6-metoxy-1,4-benzoquinol methylase